MSGEITDRFWEKIIGHISESDIDVRWILRQPNDSRAHGSLRIVSHPDLDPGYVRAYASFVTSRRPKTEEEKRNTIDQYLIEEQDLEIYTLDEHITTQEMIHEDRFQDIEKLFNVDIFE